MSAFSQEIARVKLDALILHEERVSTATRVYLNLCLYQIWLVYEMFRGSITREQLSWTEGQDQGFRGEPEDSQSASFCRNRR